MKHPPASTPVYYAYNQLLCNKISHIRDASDRHRTCAQTRLRRNYVAIIAVQNASERAATISLKCDIDYKSVKAMTGTSIQQRVYMYLTFDYILYYI